MLTLTSTTLNPRMTKQFFFQVPIVWLWLLFIPGKKGELEKTAIHDVRVKTTCERPVTRCCLVEMYTQVPEWHHLHPQSKADQCAHTHHPVQSLAAQFLGSAVSPACAGQRTHKAEMRCYSYLEATADMLAFSSPCPSSGWASPCPTLHGFQVVLCHVPICRK